MKTASLRLSVLFVPCLGIASFATLIGYGQSGASNPASSASSGGGQMSSEACSQPPCTSVRARTQQSIKLPPPGPVEFTEAQKEEIRYERLFSELEGQERIAKREEDAGNTQAAASWRGYFARQSGLTPAEAEIIKKLVADYKVERSSVRQRSSATLLAVRHANPGVRMTRLNSPELEAAAREREALLPNFKAKLVAELGSKSFTRLDSYMIHSHDNEKRLDARPAPTGVDRSGAAAGKPGAN